MQSGILKKCSIATFCLAVGTCKKIVFRWGYEYERICCRTMVRAEFCSPHREKLYAVLSRFDCLILNFFLMHSCLQIKDNLCETCDFRATVIFKFASSVVENIDITLNTLSSSLFMPFSFSVLLVQVIFTGFERCIAEPYCWTLAQRWRKIEFASACFTHSKFSPWGIRLICSQG